MRPPTFRIALTGGSGFIGRRFADQASARGHRIRFLSRHPTANPAEDHRALDLIDGPVDPDVLTDCDAVVHLAAHIPRDHDDPAEAKRCWNVNALGTLYLAQAAAEAGVRHFIQTTSANAYASWETEPDETAAMFPRSRGYYLGSKMMQEIYADQVCRRADLPLATLRLASVYGPGQMTGAVAALAAAINLGKPLTLVEGGCFAADFVHVDDVVQALMLAIEQKPEGPLNVGSGARTTIADLAHLLVTLTGQSSALIRCTSGTGSGDAGFPALSIGRMRKLGYAPRDLTSGLSTMIVP